MSRMMVRHVLKLEGGVLSPVQATQLPCFDMLIDRLGNISMDEDEHLMLHQLFQAIMLARLEAQKQNAPDPALRIPHTTYETIRRCATYSVYTLACFRLAAHPPVVMRQPQQALGSSSGGLQSWQVLWVLQLYAVCG